MYNKITTVLFKIGFFKAIEEFRKAYKRKRIVILKKNFKYIGCDLEIDENFIIKNPQYISIGNNFSSYYNLRLEAWDEYQGKKFYPEIIIGNNVACNSDCHIGCINKVIINDNVLMASRVYISDHSHGEISKEALKLVPTKRPLISKGPVIIEENVWIGEGACIFPGVTIGRNTIIGANAVVTTSMPANVVVAGVPAKIIRTLND